MLICRLYVFFAEVSVQVSRPIFFFKPDFLMGPFGVGLSYKHIKHQAVVGGVVRLQAWPCRVADDCE